MALLHHLLVSVLCVSVVMVTEVPDTNSTSTSAPPTPTKMPLPPDVRPCRARQTEYKGPELPHLDQQFEALIEATFSKKAYTTTIREYYDYTNNRGAVYQAKDGTDQIYLYDFDTYEAFLLAGEKCSHVNMTENHFNFFEFDHTDTGGHIGGVNDLFQFGSMFNETYVGTTEIRGIPVNHWNSCIEWDRYNAVFEVDYYFTTPDYNTPVGKKQIPVRAVFKGKPVNNQQTKTWLYDYTYDFVLYRPGPVKDQTVFEVPRGVLCEHKAMNRTRPSIPDIFSLDIEIVHPTRKYVNYRKLYVDYNNNLTRLDIKPSSRAKTALEIRFGMQPLSVIHDYSTGLQYAINRVTQNCTVSNIPLDSIDSVHVPGHDKLVSLKHGNDILRLKDIDFFYQGQRSVREIPCEVWSGVKKDTPTAGSNIFVELYFAKSDWTTEMLEDNNEKRVLMGFWMKQTDNASHSTEMMNYIFEYLDETPSLESFSISMCYTNAADVKHLVVRLAGPYNTYVAGKLHIIHPALRKQIAEQAGVAPIRVTDIFFDPTSDQEMDAWFTLLNKPPVEGNVLGGIDPISVDDAYKNLKKAVDAGWTLTIMYPDEKKQLLLAVKKNSLMTNKEARDPRDQPLCQENHLGYTGGSMAGLGISMLIIGCLFGIGVGFYLWKRNRGIPYQVQD